MLSRSCPGRISPGFQVFPSRVHESFRSKGPPFHSCALDFRATSSTIRYDEGAGQLETTGHRVWRGDGKTRGSDRFELRTVEPPPPRPLGRGRTVPSIQAGNPLAGLHPRTSGFPGTPDNGSVYPRKRLQMHGVSRDFSFTESCQRVWFGNPARRSSTPPGGHRPSRLPSGRQ